MNAAILVLNFLATDTAEAGLSQIARATGINKSTCFNVLIAPMDRQLIVKDRQSATYRLGPRLIELGTASRRNFSGRSLYHQVLQPMVDESGIRCVIGQPLGDMSGLIVSDNVLPSDVRKRAVTPPIGFRYPINAPAMGRAVLAYLGDEEACDILKSHGLKSPGGKTHFCAELQLIRDRGFSISHEEYKAGINAVAVCILGRQNNVAAIASLVGRSSELPPKMLQKYGADLVRAARAIKQPAIETSSQTAR